MPDLSQRITNLPESKRNLLDALLRDEGVDVSSLPMRPRREAGTTSFPLSFAQQRMWFLNQLTPDDPFYNMTAVFRAQGNMNTAAFSATLNALFQRHEVLRTTFHLVQGQPVQRIGSHRPLTVPVQDLRTVPAAEREAKVRELAMAEGQQVFDLTRGPLLRLSLLQLSATEHVVLLTMHHIVADGWSLGVLQRELSGLYQSFCGRPSPSLPELPIQYADFAQLQRGWLEGSVLNRQLGYWMSQLEPLPAMLRLPTDRPRPAEQTFHGRRFEVAFPGWLSERLKYHGQRQGGTLFMVLLAAFQLLLGRYAGQEDVAVGSPIANRNRREIEDLIGFFANSLVLRTDLSGNPTFVELIERVRDVTLGAYANQDVPFEMLVERLQPARDLSYNPIFQVVFALQNAPLAPFELYGLEVEPLELDNETTRFDLELHLWDRPDGLSGYFVYNIDLFDESTLNRLSDHFHALLAEIAEHPERPIAELQWDQGTGFVPLSSPRPNHSPEIDRALIAQVDTALRQHPLVDDCVVLDRVRTTSDRALVGYVVWTGNLGGTGLSADLFPMLPPSLPPLYLVPVTSLPLTSAGSIDEAALTRLDVIDTNLIERWEARLQELPGIDQVAVLAQEAGVSRPALHLADLIPNWQRSEQARGGEHVDDGETIRPREPGHPARPSEALSTRAASAISYGLSLQLSDDAPHHLAAALRRAATRWPDHGMVYPQPDGSEVTQSYAGLLDEAERIVAGLRDLGLQPGQLVILQMLHNQDFIPAFWGCIWGGLIPVPLAVAPSYDDTSNSAVNKLLNAWETLDASLILTSATIAPGLRSLGRGRYSGLQVAEIETLRQYAPDHRAHEAAPDDVTLLLLTSGSTGQPKAVMQSHHSLLCRSAGTAQMNDFTSHDVSLNWMPLDHVGGIVMFHVRDVYIGCQQIHAPIAEVLQRPLQWLDWIDHYRATITWAPNFAYGLINGQAETLEKRRWDLSSMRFILNAGEAIVPKTARRFLQLLAPHGLPATCMFPAWGMSETSSAVTFLRSFTLENTSDEDTFVTVGAPIPGMSIRIVDPYGQLVDEGVVGSLQVTGESVTSGYYQAPALNAEAFSADGWFHTGDLGTLRDGQLTITGREKDVVIVNGVNYYSHEIEAAVEAVAGVELSYTAACAVRDAGSDTDRLAIFFSPAAMDDTGLPLGELELLSRIRQHVLDHCGLNPTYLVPLPHEDIPKTSIGKIQRTALKQRFEAGDFGSILKGIDILRGNANTIPDWIYRRIWCGTARRNPDVVEPSAAAEPRLTLMFVDELGLGRQVAERLADANRRCVIVEASTTFARLDRNHFRVNPAEPEHYQTLMTNIVQAGHHIGQILHLWTYTPYRGEVTSVASLREAQSTGLYSLLLAIQALVDIQGDESSDCELAVISSHTQATSPDALVACEKSTMIGLLKTIPLELPWLHCRHIDVEIEAGETVTAHDDILQEIALQKGEPEVAYRQGQRLTPKLQKIDMHPPESQAPSIRSGGLYLLAGGLGGIGTHLATLLMTEFSAKIIIIGRTQLPAREQWPKQLRERDDLSTRLQHYIELENHVRQSVPGSGEFVYETADVSDFGTLQRITAEAEARWQTPLAGVIQMAGEDHLVRHWAEMEQRRVTVETPQTFEDVFRAKVYGTWTLQQLIKDRPEASLISFSSVNSLFGAATFGAYAAAHSFLDTFTVYQHHHGHPASRVYNWSIWDNIGMSADSPATAREASRAMGYHIVGKEQGLNTFMAGLWRDEPQLIVGLDDSHRQIRRHLAAGEVQVQRLCGYLTRRASDPATPLPAIEIRDEFGTLSHCEQVVLTEMPQTSSGDIDRLALRSMGQHSLATTREQVAPQTDLERTIASIWAEALQTEVVSISDNFFELGGHSVLLAQVHGKLRAALDQDLPIVDLFRYPTIHALASHLNQVQDEKPTVEVFQDRAAKQRAAIQRQRQFRRHR